MTTTTDKPANVCAHGSLARQCLVCELIAECDALKAEREALAADVLELIKEGSARGRKLEAAEAERDALAERLRVVEGALAHAVGSLEAGVVRGDVARFLAAFAAPSLPSAPPLTCILSGCRNPAQEDGDTCVAHNEPDPVDGAP